MIQDSFCFLCHFESSAKNYLPLIIGERRLYTKNVITEFKIPLKTKLNGTLKTNSALKSVSTDGMICLYIPKIASIGMKFE